jgi:hypothetical protein
MVLMTTRRRVLEQEVMVALAAAAISAIAAIVAIWQAKIARRQSRIA